MSDPKNIKDQTTIKSEDVTPEDAAKNVDTLKEEDLKDVSGGLFKSSNTPYGDWLG